MGFCTGFAEKEYLKGRNAGKDHSRTEEKTDAMEPNTLAFPLCLSLPLALCLSLSLASSRRFVAATDMARIRKQVGSGLGFPKGHRYGDVSWACYQFLIAF